MICQRDGEGQRMDALKIELITDPTMIAFFFVHFISRFL
jgi:hypothetical protein